jgi:hypothetical protein
VFFRGLIRESKNSTKESLPSISDIKDGLFKLILYSNIDKLTIDNKPVEFSTCLKLTGSKIEGALGMPCSDSQIEAFFTRNKAVFKSNQERIIKLLNQEASNNNKLTAIITGNE